MVTVKFILKPFLVWNISLWNEVIFKKTVKLKCKRTQQLILVVTTEIKDMLKIVFSLFIIFRRAHQIQPRYSQVCFGCTIELYIRTRGRTNTTGPQRDVRATMYACWIRSTCWSLCLLNADAMLFCQLTKWPHKHTLSNACLFNLACRARI